MDRANRPSLDLGRRLRLNPPAEIQAIHKDGYILSIEFAGQAITKAHMQTQSDAPRRTDQRAFLFEGRLNSASFTEFARHRAARLDLVLAIQTHTDQSVRLSVGGQPDLIDMFEMAMSLGPQDCIILDVIRLR